MTTASEVGTGLNGRPNSMHCHYTGMLEAFTSKKIRTTSVQKILEIPFKTNFYDNCRNSRGLIG